jgi:hypothetical protein
MKVDNLERRRYSQSEITQEIKNIFTYFDNYRKQYEEQVIENYQTFIGYRDEAKEEGKSNLHIPKTYEILDTIRARFLTTFFNKRPYIEFEPMPTAADLSHMVVNEEKAEVAASFVDEQLEKNNIKSVFYDFVTTMLFAPASFLSVGWRYEKANVKRKTKVPEFNQFTQSYTGRWFWDTVESEETIWDDNEINNVDFFDFWGDPDSTNIDDARAVFHREWITKKRLREKLELLQNIGDGIVYDIDIDKLTAPEKAGEGKYRRLSSVGITSGGYDPFKSSKNENINDKEELELLHYWEDDRHAILVNRQEVIYDGANPYWRHRKKPFVKATYDQLPNEFYGLSAVQIIKPMQEEINTMHNQRMDNVNMLINKMWKRLRGSNIKDEDLISKANGVIDVDNMEDLQQVQMSDIPQSAFVSEQKLTGDLQAALGTPANVRGANTSDDQSATEAQIVAQSAGTRFGVKIELFASVGLKRLAMMMDLNNQQFICDERAARIDPEERNSWRSIAPDDLIGEFDYRPATSSVEKAANKELRRQQLTEILGFLTQAQVPFINYKKMIEEWLEEFDITNPEKFMIPEQVYEMIRRQAIEEFTQQQGVPVGQNDFATTGNLGKMQTRRPKKSAGGMSSMGQPQPQPFNNGGR